MPQILNVTLKDGADASMLQAAKQKAIDQGGKINHEFTLIKGFVVEIPDDKVSVLETDDHVHVERDGEVKTQ